MNILVLGGSGQVGTALRSLAWPGGVDLHAPARSQVDIADETAVSEAIASRPWSCVVNAAGYTAVDAAEEQTEAAWRANARAPALIAAATAKSGTPLIHLSTDYVFDGQAAAPYKPQAQIRPMSVYGTSKAAGEHAVRTANRRHLIVRTSWVVSPHGSNFVKTMLRLALKGEVLRVVNDQTGRPTSAADLAAAIRTATLRLAGDPAAPVGTYHFANAGQTTWYELAAATMAGAQRRGAPSAPVQPVRTRDYKTAAIRPANSVLCTDTLTADYGIEPRPWQRALEDILDALLP